VVGIWEQVVGSVPSQKTRETLRAWVTIGYSDAAIESALKTAVKNKANAPAQYATSILRNGSEKHGGDGRIMTPDGVPIDEL
jgi:Holliday junction resolvasome RuvABC DNA-binding subunit